MNVSCVLLVPVSVKIKSGDVDHFCSLEGEKQSNVGIKAVKI